MLLGDLESHRPGDLERWLVPTREGPASVRGLELREEIGVSLAAHPIQALGSQIVVVVEADLELVGAGPERRSALDRDEIALSGLEAGGHGTFRAVEAELLQLHFPRVEAKAPHGLVHLEAHENPARVVALACVEAQLDRLLERHDLSSQPVHVDGFVAPRLRARQEQKDQE